MLAAREGHHLAEWMSAVEASGLAPLTSFVVGLRRDQAAASAGLREPDSSGAVEGTVNKIKCSSRKPTARAGFDLLRKRVLLA